MSLEFLALNWEMIDHEKYKHRFTNLNKKDNKLPADAYCQCYFDIKTFKLAF